MNGPSTAALVTLAVSAVALTLFGVRFYQRQNAGAFGGRISKAKAYWLPFAIFFWFVVCPVIALDVDGARGLRLALASFGACMWMRGAIEMVMLYVTKNWRPPMGITHDVICIVLLAAVAAWDSDGIRAMAFAMDPWLLALLVLAVVSLCVEIHHAWSFFQAVQGATTGDDGVWFADDVEERFRQINANTLRWNIILSMGVGAVLLRYLGLLP